MPPFTPHTSIVLRQRFRSAVYRGPIETVGEEDVESCGDARITPCCGDTALLGIGGERGHEERLQGRAGSKDDGFRCSSLRVWSQLNAPRGSSCGGKVVKERVPPQRAVECRLSTHQVRE